jgi:hypothetical protein
MGEIEKKPSVGVSFEECLRRVFNGTYECRHAPEDEIEPGEVILGILENPVARNAYSLWSVMAEGASRFSKDLPNNLSKAEEQKGEIRRLKCQMHQLGNRVDCVKAIFWELVYSDFPKAREADVSVAIRANWTVVIFKSPPSLFLELFGKRLFD